ncbi:hypothetical protein PIB30_072340 [Stylosanthes scabra]|uniref:Uncharacterized protein n=1 Tax=Stylosanthes scabra TaxID=79078 RepID=A0ABU6ZMS7_9FABA|nr:hypothetical protein [Stylosanthes scabra]
MTVAEMEESQREGEVEANTYLKGKVYHNNGGVGGTRMQYCRERRQKVEPVICGGMLVAHIQVEGGKDSRRGTLELNGE